MVLLSVAESLAQAEQLFRAGRLDEMDGLCHAILKVNQTVADAHRFLGLGAYVRGRLPEAVAHVQRALALAPREAAAHDNLSLFLLAQGRTVEAEAAARKALDLHPTLAGAAHNLGLALRAQGRYAEAETALRQSLDREPNNANTWNNLAAVLEQLHQLPEAVISLERAVQLRPDFALARENLRRLRAVPTIASSATQENNRGVKLLAERRYAEAETAFRRALLLDPQLPPEATYNLALALKGQGKLAEAETLFLRVLSRLPNWSRCQLSLADLYFTQRRLSDAETAYRRAAALAPTDGESLNSLAANVLNNQGRIDEARATYRQALARQPGHALCHSNLLLNEQYAPEVTPAGLAEAHAYWECLHAAPLRSTWRPFAHDADPERPLRLGFVSGDFSYHPVGIFLAPVLEHLDRNQWVTVCYASQHTADDLTRRLMRSACLWRGAADLSDEALTEQVRADQIDLLLDLSGHTGRNRLLTFARRPAPVQLTWMGYVGTTGLAAIDYLIADRYHVPSGSEPHLREQVLRLPDGYLCYEPPPYAPPVGPLPAQVQGRVTFGSFNNTAKLNPEVVACWAEILRRVPGAHLVLKYHWLSDPGARQRFREQFGAAGIDPDRLEMHGSTSHVEQLALYNQVDVALDPFPYAGGLTTCEALWMGVPVVTAPGRTFAGRHSLSHMTNAGFTDTIAPDRAGYVEQAVTLAHDLPKLAGWRAGLRERMRTSPLCDLPRFVAHLSAALRQVWRSWCVRQLSGDEGETNPS
jgi:protein O-GlcNAc transferase